MKFTKVGVRRASPFEHLDQNYLYLTKNIYQVQVISFHTDQTRISVRSNHPHHDLTSHSDALWCFKCCTGRQTHSSFRCRAINQANERIIFHCDEVCQRYRSIDCLSSNTFCTIQQKAQTSSLSVDDMHDLFE